MDNMPQFNSTIGKNAKIAVFPADDQGCGMYRVILPYNHLKNNYDLEIDVMDLKYLHSDKVTKQYDIIVVQRVTGLPEFQKIKMLKQAGKTIIHEIDDNLFNLPLHNHCYPAYAKGSIGRACLFETMKIADYIHVTTPYLAHELSKATHQPISKFYDFNNAIDHKSLLYKKNIRNTLPQDKIIIGYQGGNSHSQDLPLIIAPVKQILEDYDNVMFAFCSVPTMFNQFGIDSDRTIIIPPSRTFDKFTHIPSYFDIGLIPLQDEYFNYGKSWVKILEYGVYKTPSICSKIGDYESYGKINPDGVILIKNKHDKWLKSIRSLIENPDKRKSIGEAAYQNLVNGETSLKFQNDKRYDFFRKLIEFPQAENYNISENSKMKEMV